MIQQAELPEIKAIITEYELLKYHCGTCGKNCSASLPEGIPDSAFGPNLMGLMATLTGVFHLAKREAMQLIKELYDVDMGVGSVSNIEERVTQALDPIYERIHDFVVKSDLCKHFDETGWRDSGQRHFVWVASCSTAAIYHIDRERSAAAFRRFIGRDPKEINAVTDRYAVYNAIGGKHQHCLSHLIREFLGYAERDGPDKEIGKTLEKELRAACGIHAKYRKGAIAWEQRVRSLRKKQKKVETWLEEGMANGSDQLYRLCEKLLDNFDKLWMFVDNPEIEPTNNLAERDMRKLVIWRKKSCGTRSERGKKFVERITTVAQTLKRQGKSILSFVQEAVVNFYVKAPPPSVCGVTD